MCPILSYQNIATLTSVYLNLRNQRNVSHIKLAMHKDWSLQCHFLVLKSGPPFLTVVKRGRFSNLHYD